jgi:hypothetical protein
VPGPWHTSRPSSFALPVSRLWRIEGKGDRICNPHPLHAQTESARSDQCFEHPRRVTEDPCFMQTSRPSSACPPRPSILWMRLGDEKMGLAFSSCSASEDQADMPIPACFSVMMAHTPGSASCWKMRSICSGGRTQIRVILCNSRCHLASK